MSKVIQDPDHLIQELKAALRAHNSDVIDSIFSRNIIDSIFSRHIGDAVIAITLEDIVEQVIAWANSQENFHATWIEDENGDSDRFNFISNGIKDTLDIPLLISEIERKGNLSDGYSGGTISETLMRVYGGSRLLEIVLDAANQYDLYLENSHG